MKTILVDAVDALVVEGKIFQEMYDLLETYANKKIILTGADDKQMLEFCLNNMPYEVFTLKHDPEKTDPDYFKQLLATYDLTAGGVVYFEHNLAAVKSAESIGIESYYYDSEVKDLLSLKMFLDSSLK